MKRRYKALIILGVLLTLAALGAAGYSLQIQKISYSGNSQYTDDELTAQIFDKSYSLNPLYCFWNSHYGEKKEIPFIQTYDIEFTKWNEISIQIYEKSVVGYVNYKGYRMYFDKDGIIVESSLEALENVINIEGLEFDHIVLYQKLPVENETIFNLIQNITQMILKNELPVDKINFAKEDDLTIYIDKLKFYIGNSEYLNEKIAKIKDLLPEAEGLSGTFYMDKFTEDTDTFRFQKDGS